MDRNVVQGHNTIAGEADRGIPSLDSMLSIRDIRQRVVRSIQDAQPEKPTLRDLLALDPLTVLRLLRMARAPVNNITSTIRSIDQLSETLGSILVRRALEVDVVEVHGTESARRLWIHALATAHTAWSLAQISGSMDPEEAYFAGLLHDTDAWIAYLEGFEGAQRRREESLWDPGDWRPECSHLSWDERRLKALEVLETESVEDPIALVCKAEFLAELAGFWHPDAGTTEQEMELLSSVSKEDLIAAQSLRSRILGLLSRMNLHGTGHAPRHLLADEEENLTLFGWKREKSRLADVVTFLQHFNSSFRYRGIVTATTAASLRFLDYERAFQAVWSPEDECCWIRAKSDMSPRRLEPLRVWPSKNEVKELAGGIASNMATQLRRSSDRENALLDALGVDELLCVPMNGDFKFPSYLLLDRTLTRRPVSDGDDLRAATALASTASILTENLLLKKIGQRSKRFALTDPLTRLFNRGVGLATLEREIAAAQRSNLPLTVLMLDLDEFKNLNDKFGHIKGDVALRLCADVLGKTLRRQDTICRYGGEEFMVVLPGTTIEEASILATRVFTAVETLGASESLPLTVSIGLSQVIADRDSVESVLVRADRALYASKSHGRNRFSVDSVR